MNSIFLFISCVCLIWSAQGSVPKITKCEWNDDECHKNSAKELIPVFAEGIDDLKVERMDPMLVDFVDASTPNLELKVSNLKITGMKNCEPQEIRREQTTSKMFVKLLCTADIEADYVMNGELLVINLHGDGKVTAHLSKILIKADIDIVEKEHKDGEKYWFIKSWSHTFELKGKSDISFSNLVPNNKDVQNTIADLLASNGNEVVTELGPPLVKAVIARVVENVQHAFNHIAIKDLILS